MSDWGGPYVSIMTTTDTQGDDPVVQVTNDAGTLQTIRGIGSGAVIPRLGGLVEFRLLLVLYSGSRRGSDQLGITLMEPDGTIHTFPVQSFEYPTEPTAVLKFTIPIGIEARAVGTYWLRARVGQRVLSRIPFEIELLPQIPEAFLRM